MINVIVSNNEVHLDFYGNNFRDILEYVKLNTTFKYDKDTRHWVGSARELLHNYKSLSEIDEVSISDENYLRELADKEATPETRSIDRNPSRNIFVYPPIKGNPPHENFQLDAIRKGISQTRLAYFLSMGLGKTFLTITVLNQLFQDGDIDAVVIVAPPSGIYNWKRELLKFGNFLQEDNIMISGANHNRNPLNLELFNIKVIIMTYRHYLTLSDDWYKSVRGKSSKAYTKPCIPWNKYGTKRAIILDESHSIKNSKTRQSKVIHMHKNYFEYRYILTGTPTPNNFTEIYSQMNFLDTRIISKSYWEWVKEIADLGNRFSSYAINYIYPEKQEEYEKIFSPWIIRHMAKDVIDLPELYIKPIYCSMSDVQKRIYQSLVNDTIYVMQEKEGRIIPTKLREKFPYISMACENPLLLRDRLSNDDLVSKFNFERDHGKIEICDDLVNQYLDDNQKVTIFDFHPLTLDLLAEHYKKYNPIVIHGQSAHDNNRDDLVELFKTSNKHNMLIASFRVLATAINLVECNRIIYFSRDYSYLNWSQSIKRFHRIGQDDQVIINPLVFENSLDEYIEKVIITKSELDESLFKSDCLTKEDWRAIFNGKVLNE